MSVNMGARFALGELIENGGDTVDRLVAEGYAADRAEVERGLDAVVTGALMARGGRSLSWYEVGAALLRAGTFMERVGERPEHPTLHTVLSRVEVLESTLLSRSVEMVDSDHALVTQLRAEVAQLREAVAASDAKLDGRYAEWRAAEEGREA